MKLQNLYDITYHSPALVMYIIFVVQISQTKSIYFTKNKVIIKKNVHHVILYNILCFLWGFKILHILVESFVFKMYNKIISLVNTDLLYYVETVHFN